VGLLGRGGAYRNSVQALVIAVVGTLLALAIFVWGTWKAGGPVVVDVPPAPASPRDPVARHEDEQRLGAEAMLEPKPPAAEPAEADLGADAGDPDFFETPMRVVRRSNIRAQPAPDSGALGRADEGSIVIIVDPAPRRGYYRIATGELEGWIWGANLVAVDASEQPDPDDIPEASAAGDEPGEATARP
jgi:hypothetical protein